MLPADREQHCRVQSRVLEKITSTYAQAASPASLANPGHKIATVLTRPVANRKSTGRRPVLIGPLLALAADRGGEPRLVDDDVVVLGMGGLLDRIAHDDLERDAATAPARMLCVTAMPSGVGRSCAISILAPTESSPPPRWDNSQPRQVTSMSWIIAGVA